jgi:hypothetical protein
MMVLESFKSSNWTTAVCRRWRFEEEEEEEEEERREGEREEGGIEIEKRENE